ncbi:MAG TPA: hypothetical protein VF516_09000 [Kofleriaceae bacterium]
MDEAGTLGCARYAQVALARYGQAIALAIGKMSGALFDALPPCEAMIVGGGDYDANQCGD